MAQEKVEEKVKEKAVKGTTEFLLLFIRIAIAKIVYDKTFAYYEEK